MALRVAELDPSVDQMTLVTAGATEIREIFPPEQLPAVLDGYMWGIQVVFAISIAVSGIAVVVSSMSRWTKLNQANLVGAV